MTKKLISYDDEKTGLGLPTVVERKLENAYGFFNTGLMNGLAQQMMTQRHAMNMRDQVVYHDDFSRPDSDSSLGGEWTIPSGVWGLDDGRAALISGGSVSAAVVDTGTTDHEVTARITLPAGGRAGVTLRHTDATNHLAVVLEQAANQLRLTSRMGGPGGTLTTLATSRPVEFTTPPGEYTLRVKVSGNYLTVYVDGGETVYSGETPIIGYHLSGAPATLAGTRAGIFSVGDTSSRFDSITISDPGRTTTGADSWTANNVPDPLTTPTHDGSGQAVHPDVWDFGEGEEWNGYRYWMAMTPYAYSSEATEIPNILASHDGTTWEVPPGLTNPMSQGFDPCIAMVGDRMYVVSQGPIVTWSDDGITWVPHRYLFQGDLGEVSPSILQEDDGTFRMWSIQRSFDGTRFRCLHRTAEHIMGPWSRPQEIIMPEDVSTGRDLWHIDVVKHEGRYYAVVSENWKGTSGQASLLYMAESNDGLVWEMSGKPVLGRGTAAKWDDAQIYRSCIIPRGAGEGLWFDLWYSARGSSGKWHIGRTEIRRAG